MATFYGLPSVRDDFRCSICRQKNAFHCEHDTPYRDQLLGLSDQANFRITTGNSRRHSQRTDLSKNTSLDKQMQNTNTGQSVNASAGIRSRQDRKLDNKSLPTINTNPNTYPNTNTHTTTNAYDTIQMREQKKNKSCSIL